MQSMSFSKTMSSANKLFAEISAQTPESLKNVAKNIGNEFENYTELAYKDVKNLYNSPNIPHSMSGGFSNDGHDGHDHRNPAVAATAENDNMPSHEGSTN